MNSPILARKKRVIIFSSRGTIMKDRHISRINESAPIKACLSGRSDLVQEGKESFKVNLEVAKATFV